MSEELTEMVKDFRTHIRNNYPEEHKKIEEANVTGTGTSISTGNSPAYATPKAFGKKKDKDIEVLGYKKI